MSNQRPDLVRFNRRMDELIENVVGQNLLTPEFRAQYVKAVGLYRRVAESDTELAWDLFVSTAMYSYSFFEGLIEKVFNSKNQ
ncbi:MAG: hypothetical protein ACLQEQ_04600 [Nitrososphaerales archaeon]